MTHGKQPAHSSSRHPSLLNSSIQLHNGSGITLWRPTQSGQRNAPGKSILAICLAATLGFLAERCLSEIIDEAPHRHDVGSELFDFSARLSGAPMGGGER